jgi:hypothetical protein
MEGKPRRATGPAKGEQPATAVPDSRTDGTPGSASSSGRSVLPARGRRAGRSRAEHGREVGRRKPLKTVRARVLGRCLRLGNEPGRGRRGQDERSGVRVTSPSRPRPEPRTGQRQEGNAAREGSSGRPPPVARTPRGGRRGRGYHRCNVRGTRLAGGNARRGTRGVRREPKEHQERGSRAPQHASACEGVRRNRDDGLRGAAAVRAGLESARVPGGAKLWRARNPMDAPG